MPNTFTKTTFSTTYKDDFTDSDHYHRILFNSGKALQARELTQAQTITQKELERLGRHIFKEGSVVLPGGLTVDTNFEFVKLSSTSTTGFAVGDTLTGQTSSIQAKLLKIVAADGSDPVTFYVKYTNTSSGTSGPDPIRFTAGESLSNGSVTVDVQVTNTTANPATGRGTRAAINGGGTYFVAGHFVTTDREEIIVSRYSSTPNEVIGFKVTQDIVTVSDTNDLYDNQGTSPNLTAPGADRYRIQLNLSIESSLGDTDTFFPINKMVNGVLQREIGETAYNIVEKELATRTSEESGDYVVEGYQSTPKAGDSDSVLTIDVNPGVAYVDGYRVSTQAPTKVTVNKPRTTETINNEAIAANYGNYIIASADTSQGFIPNLDTFQTINLRSDSNFGGTTIGSARVRSMTEDGANYRLYLFDVKMNSGKKFSEARSVGDSTGEYLDLVLENGVGVIKEASNNNLFFDLGKTRPQSLGDASLIVQRKATINTTSGTGTLPSLSAGESYTNQTDWIIALDSAHASEILPNATATGNQINTGRGVSDTGVEVVYFVTKSNPTIRSKTLTDVTETGLTVESDGAGFKFVKLANTDIINLTSFVDSGTTNSVANRFALDNGQRDNFYYNGRLVLNGGQSAPTGSLTATYRHYAHSTGDFFAVNSYSHLSGAAARGGSPRTSSTTGAGGGTKYSEIPKFRQRNGEIVELRNVLDFRPYKESDGASYTASNINELPENTSSITADVTYYKGRNDILTITSGKEIKYIQGVEALDNRLTPQTPLDAMKIKEFNLNAFTDNEEDLEETFIQNRRFTMRDISGIVERIDNLEEVTTLNLLEAQTAAIEVLDSNGANRFKNGLFADDFKDLAFSDIDDSSYTATIDLDRQFILPDATTKAVSLAYDSTNGGNSNTKITSNFVTLDYSEDSYIVQTLASETENINPFEVITFVGNLRLEPDEDVWQDVRRSVRRTFVRLSTREFNERTGQNLPAINRGGQTRATVQTGSGGRGGSIRIIPFIRSRLVRFKAEALKPNTKHFLFFDGNEISAYAKEETTFVPFSEQGGEQYIGNRSTSHPAGTESLISDSKGEILGSFLVPNNSGLRFDRGQREVKLLDINTDNNSTAGSSAFATYFAEGTSRTSVRNITTFVTGFPRDPLAQSFTIQNSQGSFLTSIDVYFNTRPETGTADQNVPVRLEVRPLRNGVPSQTELVTGSQVIKQRADINIPSDLDNLTTIRSTPTNFKFDAPIFIPGNTPHAFILMADTIAYNVYVAKAGDLVIGTTDQRIKKQPSLGSLFLSQNAITWTPDQTRDMMFKVHRAKFTTNTGTAILENTNVPHTVLATTPFLTDSGSTTVTINSRGHGLGVSDKFTLFGVDSSGSFGGITGTTLQGEHTVTKVDGTGFQFVADSAATASVLVGNTDGSDITLTDNIQIDTLFPSFDTFIPSAEASLIFNGTFAKGRSFSSPTNTFAISSVTNINPFEIVRFEDPKVIAHKDLEDSDTNLLNQGTPRRSAKITATLSTTSDFVSPVINMAATSIIGENNLIDNQDSSGSASDPLNNPITFVAETDATSGSTLSKHVTVPINLEQPAVGLKVIIGANRPNLANFDLHFRTIPAGADTNLDDIAFTLAPAETIVQTDEDLNVFRDYEYTIGGLGGTLTPFTTFQLKIVMRSSNSSKIPTFRDIRAIALGT